MKKATTTVKKRKSGVEEGRLPRRTMRLHHTLIALSLIAAISACTAAHVARRVADCEHEALLQGKHVEFEPSPVRYLVNPLASDAEGPGGNVG